jgi:nitrous oxidase accessory protein NosD
MTVAARRVALWWTATIVLVIAAAVGLAVAAGDDGSNNGSTAGVSDREDVAETQPPSRLAAPTPTGQAATAPRIAGPQQCDSAALDGPSAPPAGAVAVSTAESLADIVAAHPEHTTYWLAPGTHHLGAGAYNQVVPHAGDTFIGAPGAVLDGRDENRYAFTGDAPDVTILFLTVQNFGSVGDNNNEGVVNHDSANGWTVRSSTIQNNAGAGVMLGSGNRLIGNCLRDNGQYGFNAYSPDGVTDVVLDGNEISDNNTDDWESRQPECGCTGGGKFWETNGANVTNNYVHDNRGVGLWADSNNVGFLFQNNYVSGNDSIGIMYETSYNAEILSNTFIRNALVRGPANPGFPTPAIYLSESGSDNRVVGAYNETFRVSGNVFIDNWSGIVAWENADRFAGSPANTSTGVGTLVNPSAATVAACATESKIVQKPYFDDCRWKTKNVLVEGNLFSIDPAQVPDCAPSNGCGFNGVFSNYGTYPDWSPYKAEIVQDDITFEQNNVWRDNTYTGDWYFMVEEHGNVVTWEAWRAEPYHQDRGSSLN